MSGLPTPYYHDEAAGSYGGTTMGATNGLATVQPDAGTIMEDVIAKGDLGATRGTDWEQDRLYALVNARYEAELPRNLTEAVGERIASRLLEGAEVVSVGGGDRRR